MFDAYTVKKVLPRLVAAVVLIQLSWFLFTGMIQLTTAVAYGIEGLMLAPFGGATAVSLKNIFGAVGDLGSGAGVAGLALVGVAGTIAAGGIFALGVMVFLALFVGFMTLVLRKALLIALLLLSPIALVAWILPGTERFWKIWWDNFSKLLLMFPLILIMLAAGRIFAFIFAAGVGTGFGILDVSVILISVFIPFALIPMTYKAAGAGLGAISGAISKYPADWTNKARESGRKRQAERRSKFTSGDLISSENVAARGINRVGKGLGLGWKGRYGVGERGAAAADISRRGHAAHAMKENEQLQQAQFDDEGIAVLALSGGTREGAERASHTLARVHGWDENKRRRALGVAQNVGINGSTTTAAIDLMAQNKSRMLVKTDHGDLSGDAGLALVRESAGHVAHGNAQLRENIVGSFGFHSRNAGRIDQGGENGKSMLDGWTRTSVQQHASSQGASLAAFGAHFQDRLVHGSDDEKKAAAIALMEMQNMLSSGATGENQAVINEVLATAVDHNDPRSVEEQLAASTGGLVSAADVRGLARVWDQATPGAALPGLAHLPPPGPGGTPPPASDRRLKRNIHHVGIVNDIKLYRFQYLWSSQEYVGVMAQDLTNSHPEALSKDAFGYYQVDYTKLGLSMMTIEEWNVANRIEKRIKTLS